MLCVVVLLVSLASSLATSIKQPNILLLFPDQWRFDWDGTHTDNNRTFSLTVPTLDELRRTGTRFEHAFSAAPVCAPSRAALASGREYDYAGTPCNGCGDYPISIKTFYSVLQEAGYHTMTAGKDDLTKTTTCGIDGQFHQKELGWTDGLRSGGKYDVLRSYPTILEPYGVFLNSSEVFLEDGSKVNGWEAHASCFGIKTFHNRGGMGPLCDRTSFPDELYEDNWTTENALRLLERKPSGKPWFLQVNFPGPHPPFLITANMHNSMADRSFPGPVDNPKAGKTTQCTTDDEPAKSNKDRCNYAAEIENLDRKFAMIIDKVKEIGDFDNTLIFVSSDHGEMLGDHGDTGKTKPWQGSAGVPLIISSPTLLSPDYQNKLVNEPVSIMDMAGTFIDLAGATKAPNMTTVSLRPFFQSISNSSNYRSFISSGLQSTPFSHMPNSVDASVDFGEPPIQANGYNWRMVIKQFNESLILKYICCKGDCPGAPSNVPDKTHHLMYNIVDDPFDMNNILFQYPEEVKLLHALLPDNPSFSCPHTGLPDSPSAPLIEEARSALIGSLDAPSKTLADQSDTSSGRNSQNPLPSRPMKHHPTWDFGVIAEN